MNGDFFQNYIGDLLAIGTGVSWSLAVICFRLAGLSESSYPFNLLKSFGAFLLFFATAWILGSPLLLPLPTEAIVRLVISAILGIFLGDLFFLSSLKRLGASMQAIVDCLYAPMMIVLGYFFFGESLSRLELIGGALVLSAIIVGGRDSHRVVNVSSRERWLGLALGALSQVCMAIAILMVMDLLKSQDFIWLMTFRFFVGTVALLIFPLLVGKPDLIRSAFRKGLGMKWAYLGIFLGPFLSTLCWFGGFKYILIGRAAIYNQTASIFMILLAVWILKEKMTRPRLLAAVLGIFGALLVGLQQ